MTIEQRLDQLKKRTKRLTAALTLMAVAICTVVTLASTGDKDGDFDSVRVLVTNDAGDLVVMLSTDNKITSLVIEAFQQGEKTIFKNKDLPLDQPIDLL